MSRLRAELREANASCAHLLVLNPLRPLLDIALDWMVVLSAVSAVVWLSWWAAIPAVFVVGNRQRALGNMLHEAGHRNICRDRRINDVFTRACIAPLVFASLSTYRSLHFKHHMELGQQDRDPDFLLPPTRKPDRWLASYARFAFHGGNWTSFAVRSSRRSEYECDEPTLHSGVVACTVRRPAPGRRDALCRHIPSHLVCRASDGFSPHHDASRDV